MMCSSLELGLGNDHSGLLILHGNTKVGACLHDEIEINGDTVFDLSLTANRGDCLSHIGVARDVAAKLDLPLKPPEIAGLSICDGSAPDGHFLSEISIETKNCECYSAVCVKNIKIGESPKWMQRDLAAIGMRSINNVVDIGNWVMIETGQPVHVFDARKILGNKLLIRQAADGETLTSLDGKKRTLNSSMVVICDGERPLVLAGVVGTLDAEVDANTVDVMIESAYFNPENIRKSAQQLNVSTESSYRFSRDIDAANVAQYGQRVANLVAEICGGEIVSKCWKVGSPSRQAVGIEFKPSFIAALCGFQIPLAEAEATLERLGFTVEKRGADAWRVIVPAHRPDITCAADVVSECARIYGADKIPATAVKCLGIHRQAESLVNFHRSAGAYLSNHGFFECYNISLRSRKEAEKFFGKNSALAMRNPLAADQNCYRNSLLPGLLDSLEFNAQNGNYECKFFETGRIAVKIDGKFHECFSVCCAMSTLPLERSWQTLEPSNFYDIKELILPVLKNFSKKIPTFDAVSGSEVWQDGYSASCGFLNREKFQAICGLLNVNLTREFDLKQRVLAAEIVIHPSIFARKQGKITYTPFSQFPRVSKDLSLIVRGDEFAAAVENNVLRLAKKSVSGDVFIESVNIFDAYTGKEIPMGMKNIGVTINYRSNSRTLTDFEVQIAFNALQSEIEKLYEIRKLT
jgi:phenylalanyl-tRNA synthetase beta chain